MHRAHLDEVRLVAGLGTNALDLPSVVEVVPRIPEAEGIIGMRIDQALDVLKRAGWREKGFEMRNSWERPELSRHTYTLVRPHAE